MCNSALPPDARSGARTWGQGALRLARSLARSHVVLTIALLAFTWILAHRLNDHYPIEQWLFWRYAHHWFWTMVFTAACLSSGHAVLARLRPYSVPARERLLLAFGAGLFVFATGMFLAGLARLYGPAWFVAWPAALIAVGGRSALRDGRRAWSRLRAAAARASQRRPRSPTDAWLWAFGLLGLLLVYLPILTPENTAYDAQWYHLSVAEHYAAQRGIGPMPEGAFNAALPHLATLLYAWAFLLPAGGLFDQIELAAHIEFVIFLFTLYAVPLLVRWIVPGSRSRLAWVAVFLFPGIFVYDSSLSTAADHITAFWAIPIWLALRRALGELRIRAWAWLGVTIAGALMTKYQGLLLVVFPALAVAARTVGLVIKPRPPNGRTAGLVGPLFACAVGLVLTAPHWLANAVWHHDPLYPFLHRFLPSRPWTDEAENLFENYYKATQMWRPPGSWVENVLAALRTVLSFAFEPHDWKAFHRSLPIFGFMATAALVCAPFVARARRLWMVLAASHLGIFVWYWGSHQDRYLQILLPWLAAGAAAFVALVWRTHWTTRTVLAALIALQVVWGGDAPFIPHTMMRVPPVKVVADLLSSGYRRDLDKRQNVMGEMGRIGRTLPPQAKVLVHDLHMHLGLQSMSVSDAKAWQGAIHYDEMPTPRALQLQLEGWHVTHMAWQARKTLGLDSLAGEFVFHEFARRYAVSTRTFDNLVLAQMPPAPLPDRRWLDEEALVLMGSAAATYASGIYRIGDLTVLEQGEKVPFPRPRRPVGDLTAAVADVAFIVYAANQRIPLPTTVTTEFTTVVIREPLHLLIRSASAP